ncbi:MAG: hypothetical protein WBR26_12795 [Candidatus Acidiferrum sp.]
MRIGSFPGSRLTLFLVCSAALLACCFVPPSALAQNEKGAGITMSGDADAKDIGLPLYPGSRRHPDNNADSPGVNFGLWGGGSGFKLAVLKMESDDSMDKVADYYKKKLAKFGKVLDCSHPSADTPADNDENSKRITCADDKPDSGGLLFKAGTKSDQHLVSITPAPKGSLYQLVHLVHWEK